MSLFQNIIISVGGNELANSTVEDLFKKKYDQLISLAKTRNGQCTLHKMSPRQDTDVTKLNRCIERLSEFWHKHDVHRINSTHNYFKGLPMQRFSSIVGIHLTCSDFKRLLDAMNRTLAWLKIMTCAYLIDQNLVVIQSAEMGLQSRDNSSGNQTSIGEQITFLLNAGLSGDSAIQLHLRCRKIY